MEGPHTMTPHYTDMQLDALRELANIGSGNAGTSLSAMLGHQVDISVPAASALPLDARAGWALLRGTVKPGDGIVSRWLNRRISRPISAFLLLFPFIRPIHATIGTALIGVAMLIALLTGSYTGMIWGSFLFQFASIFDGVDGG